ncbi:MAG: HAD-IA family hydrolase [Chloroflexi bacterium]|nr:HAD-IA family hydrolase [Chloroflexota bacterium]
MNTTSFELVIFDCDGVLVESEPLATRVFVQILAEHGFKVNYEEYLRKFSGAVIYQRLEAAAQELKWTPPANFMSIFDERLSVLTEKELKSVPGIHALLKSLSVPACVASNGSRDEIVLRLKIAELTDYFGKAIFSGLEMPHPKPAPDVFLAAAEAFKAAPDRCIVIEDSVLGTTAAIRAGMRVYGHAAFTSSASLKATGAIPFDNMMELKSLLSDVCFEKIDSRQGAL